MTFDDYDEQSGLTVVYPKIHETLPIYPVLKLTGEAGEVSEKIGKIIRDQGGKLTPANRIDLLKELGDVLWYISACARDLNSSLEEIAQMNISKLNDRASRGVIGGSGDDR